MFRFLLKDIITIIKHYYLCICYKVFQAFFTKNEKIINFLEHIELFTVIDGKYGEMLQFLIGNYWRIST